MKLSFRPFLIHHFGHITRGYPGSRNIRQSTKWEPTSTLEVTQGQIWGKSQVNLPQMPPDSGGIWVGVDQRNHPFAPDLPPGWLAEHGFVVAVPEIYHDTDGAAGCVHPPQRQPSGKSWVNILQMPPDHGGICTGVDQRNHSFAPGMPPGRYLSVFRTDLEALDASEK